MDIVCPECRGEVRLSEENTAPLEKAVPVDTGDPGERFETMQWEQDRKNEESADHCARCGKAFRGDWDQYESAKGLVCNICAKLATADRADPSEVMGEVKPIQSIQYEEEADILGRHEELDEPIREPTLAEKYPKEMQIGLAVGISLLLLTTLYYSLFDTTPVPTSDRSMDVEITKLPYFITLSLDLLYYVALWVLPLYLTLHMSNKFLFDSPWMNALDVGFVGVGCAFISLVPIIGGIFGWFIMLFVVWHRYDFGLLDLFNWTVCSFIAGIGLFALHFLAVGIIANIFL
jgi:hypothetical protein